MFGPNAKSGSPVLFHHREPAYRALLHGTVSKFRQLFRLPEEEWDVLLLTGSGTLANEAVLWSLRTRPHVGMSIVTAGEFSRRLRGMARALDYAQEGELTRRWGAVVYETGESRYNSALNWPEHELCIRFADCVSSFPYYAPPVDADVWTTVTSKQLGAAPVMSIAVVRRKCWEFFRSSDHYSYLNLRRYADFYHERKESPHTPAIPLLLSLNSTLDVFDDGALRRTISRRREILRSVFTREQIVGEGPVLTVVESAIPLLIAQAWQLYHSAAGWQFFLYSGKDEEYERFVQQYKPMRP